MDMKSAFFDGFFLQEDAHIEQSPGFESSECSNYVYKLHKTLYRLNKLFGHGMKGS